MTPSGKARLCLIFLVTMMITNQRNGNFADGGEFDTDIFVSALGYESRCLELLKKDKLKFEKALFIRFPNSDLFSYRDNLLIADGLINKIYIDYKDADLFDQIRLFFQNIPCGKKVLIDISSMNRTMISAVILAISTCQIGAKIKIIYMAANYSAPDLKFTEIIEVGPVLPEFSAFDIDMDAPTDLIFGVGYEYGVAVGLINRMEPRNTLCMYARGHDPRFDESVRTANFDYSFPGMDVQTAAYNVFNPIGTYSYLEKLVRNKVKFFNLTIIPMGPKILSVIFSLLAIEYFGKLSMWRVVRRAGDRDSIASGDFVEFDIDFERLLSAGSKISEFWNE